MQLAPQNFQCNQYNAKKSKIYWEYIKWMALACPLDSWLIGQKNAAEMTIYRDSLEVRMHETKSIVETSKLENYS